MNGHNKVITLPYNRQAPERKHRKAHRQHQNSNLPPNSNSEEWNGKQRSIWGAWNLLKTNKCEYAHNRLPIKRNFFSFRLFYANWSPFLPIAKTHNDAKKKTDFCYRMNSIPFMIDSANISFYGFSSFISYFNHDRLIAVVSFLQLPHPPRSKWICRSCNKQNMKRTYWLICAFNVFNCPLCLSGNARK